MYGKGLHTGVQKDCRDKTVIFNFPTALYYYVNVYSIFNIHIAE